MSNAATLYQTLPIEQLQASRTNPRQHFDRAGLDELKASICAPREDGSGITGIEQPLIVRPLRSDGMPELYEVVCGGRRYLAAQELKLAELPCLVREMTDEEARSAQITENLQRAGIHPLEEAEAFRELRDRLGSIPAVAAKVSKEQSYVAKCLRLLSLTLHSADALRGQLITIDHALLLARLGDAEQNEALKWTLDRQAGSKTPVSKVIEERLEVIKREAANDERYAHHHWECETVLRLKSHIEGESGIVLSRAPWNLEGDTLLPDVPCCAACDKNTKANAPLFGDLEIGEPTCTDGACFYAKKSALVWIKMCQAGADEETKPKKLVPRLSWKYSTVKPAVCFNDITAAGAMANSANPAKVLEQGQWVEAKKGSCPNVRPGVTADWSDAGERGYMGSGQKLRKPGETLLVCIAVGCKVHRKDWEKPKSANGSRAQRADPAEEARKEKEIAFLLKTETAIRTKIFAAIVGSLDAAKAIRIVAGRIHSAPEHRKRILELLPEAGGELVEALVLIFQYFRNDTMPNHWQMSHEGGVASDRKALWNLAKSAGVDANAIVAKHFHDEGSIAPAADRLYPKGVPWPKKLGDGSVTRALDSCKSIRTREAARSAAAKAAPKTSKKPSAKASEAGKPEKRNLSAVGKKRVAELKKRIAAPKKNAAAKKEVVA